MQPNVDPGELCGGTARGPHNKALWSSARVRNTLIEPITDLILDTEHIPFMDIVDADNGLLRGVIRRSSH